jgi:hypothetical protein
MSIDFKIFAVCDHKVSREVVQIDSDRRTLRIPRLTSSSTDIQVYINGTLVNKNSSVSGYTVETDEFGINDLKKKIVFANKKKSLDDFFEVSYPVLSSVCPKCLGLKILNDESYNSLGLINTVSNEEKILQEVKKGLLTTLGGNPFHSWWGTKLNQVIGSKVANADSLRAFMIQEVSVFLDKYLDIQTQQSQYQGVTDRESFYQLLLVDVESDPDDPTIWTLSVIFQNRTGADMVFEKKFEAPSEVTSGRAITV